MKALTIFIAFCILSSTSIAQIKTGIIVYERKTNMHKRIPPQDERMKNMIPEFVTDQHQLLFTENESVISAVHKEPDVRDNMGEQHNAVFISSGGGISEEVYKSYTNNKVIEVRELGPRKYLIEDSLQNHQWKLDATASKNIASYNCKKATTKNNRGETVVAWYTEEIACTSGPENYGGLPGMILELSINENETTYTAVEIKATKDAVVKAPMKGKKITKKEFEKILSSEPGAPPPGATPIRIAF